jgi:hypothetical protein
LLHQRSTVLVTARRVYKRGIACAGAALARRLLHLMRIRALCFAAHHGTDGWDDAAAAALRLLMDMVSLPTTLPLRQNYYSLFLNRHARYPRSIDSAFRTFAPVMDLDHSSSIFLAPRRRHGFTRCLLCGDPGRCRATPGRGLGREWATGSDVFMILTAGFLLLSLDWMA